MTMLTGPRSTRARSRRYAILVALIIALGGSASAAPTTISGHLKTITGAAQIVSTSARFELLYCGANQAYVSGTGRLPVTTFTLTQGHGIDSTGTISTSLYGNDQITCGATSDGTRWRVTYIVNGEASVPCDYHITGPTFNLDSQACLNITATQAASTAVYVWPTTISTTNFVASGNFTGNLVGNGTGTWTGSANLSSLTGTFLLDAARIPALPYMPSSYVPTIANVTGLQAALDAKQASLGFTAANDSLVLHTSDKIGAGAKVPSSDASPSDGCVQFSSGKLVSTGSACGAGGGGGGVNDHALLSHLAYADAGHTGFQPALGYTPLNPANNLSEVTAATARTNLGLGTAATQASTAFDAAGAAETVAGNLTTHTSNTSNPHSVTKTQVGLGNADNTSDLNKPISTATQSALDLKAADNAVVKLTGNQSVGGDKTFTGTTSMQGLTATSVARADGKLLEPRAITFLFGDCAGSVMVDTDDRSNIWANRLGQTVTISEVDVWVDGGSPTFMLTDGSGNNILAGNLTGSSSWASTTSFNGTYNQIGYNSAIASTGKINFLTVSAGGTAKCGTMVIKYQ